MVSTAKELYKNAPEGQYNKWYFDELVSPREETIYKEAQEQYYAPQKPWEFNPKKTVLLIIDLQNDFCDPEKGKFWLPGNTKMMPRMKKLLEYCRSRGIMTIFTAHQSHPSGRDLGLMHAYLPPLETSLIEGDDGVKIWHEIEPRSDEWVINHKRRYDSFWETGLDDVLRTRESDTIILTGCCTNYCSSTTCRSGMQRGYKIAFLSDCNASDDPAVHEEVCKTMNRGFARVMSTEQCIAELEAKHNI